MHDMTHIITMRRPDPPPTAGSIVFFRKVERVFSLCISSLSFFIVVVHDDDDDVNDDDSVATKSVLS